MKFHPQGINSGFLNKGIQTRIKQGFRGNFNMAGSRGFEGSGPFLGMVTAQIKDGGGGGAPGHVHHGAVQVLGLPHMGNKWA